MTLKIISIEGNIGSGKSTLVEGLKQKYKAQEHICFLQEPVDEWSCVRDNDGKTILEKYYGNQERYAFSFQMMAYISRIHILKKTIKKYPNSIIITERSIYTDKNVFAKMLYDDNKIEEINYQIYNKWFEEFIKDIPLTGIIYITTTPEKSLERIKIRNRKGEQIPIEYLKKCHDYHNDWIYNDNKPILSLNGNIEFKELISPWYNEIIHFISRFIKKNDTTNTYDSIYY